MINIFFWYAIVSYAIVGFLICRNLYKSSNFGVIRAMHKFWWWIGYWLASPVVIGNHIIHIAAQCIYSMIKDIDKDLKANIWS